MRPCPFGLAIVAALTISGCGGSVFVRSGPTTAGASGTAGHASVGATGGVRVGTPGHPSGATSARIGTGGAQLSAHGPAGLVVLGALIVSGLVEYVFRKMEGRPSATDEEYIERPRNDPAIAR